MYAVLILKLHENKVFLDINHPNRLKICAATSEISDKHLQTFFRRYKQEGKAFLMCHQQINPALGQLNRKKHQLWNTCDYILCSLTEIKAYFHFKNNKNKLIWRQRLTPHPQSLTSVSSALMLGQLLFCLILQIRTLVFCTEHEVTVCTPFLQLLTV